MSKRFELEGEDKENQMNTENMEGGRATAIRRGDGMCKKCRALFIANGELVNRLNKLESIIGRNLCIIYIHI